VCKIAARSGGVRNGAARFCARGRPCIAPLHTLRKLAKRHSARPGSISALAVGPLLAQTLFPWELATVRTTEPALVTNSLSPE
jgi:hypothetical protein